MPKVEWKCFQSSGLDLVECALFIVNLFTLIFREIEFQKILLKLRSDFITRYDVECNKYLLTKKKRNRMFIDTFN